MYIYITGAIEIVSEYDQEILQSQTQTTPWHRKEEPLNHHETPGRQIEQSNQLSLPHQGDCNTRMDINLHTTKHRAITDSHSGSNINKKSTTTEQPPRNGEQPKPPRGLNALYCYQIFALDSAVIEEQEMFSSQTYFLLSEYVIEFCVTSRTNNTLGCKHRQT